MWHAAQSACQGTERQDLAVGLGADLDVILRAFGFVPKVAVSSVAESSGERPVVQI